MVDNPVIPVNEVPSFDQMHDIVIPDPVSWWPLAPGWWVVLFILAIGGLWLAATAYRRWKQQAHRRAALRELEHTPPNELSALLKRVCLAEFPRDRIASLSGQAWLEFLDQTGGTDLFTQGDGRGLLDLSYNPHFTSSDGVKDAVRNWLTSTLCKTDLQSVSQPNQKK